MNSGWEIENSLFFRVGHHAILYSTEHEPLWSGHLPIIFKATKDCTVWFAVIFDADDHAIYYSPDAKKILRPGDTFTFGPATKGEISAVVHYRLEEN